MKFVVDTNVILSALIRDSSTRKIIANFGFEFFAPSFSLSEIKKYEDYVCQKASISKNEFDKLLLKIFDYIEIIPLERYKEFLAEAEKLIKDIKDAPFLACAIALNIPAWSDDKHFQEQKKIKVLTSQEFIKKFLKI